MDIIFSIFLIIIGIALMDSVIRDYPILCLDNGVVFGIGALMFIAGAGTIWSALG